MKKRPFFALTKPKLRYETLDPQTQESFREIPTANEIVLQPNFPLDLNELALEPGEKVYTGQRLSVSRSGNGQIVSTVTGHVARFDERAGPRGRPYATVTIQTEAEDQWDDEFETLLADSPHRIFEFLASLPGGSRFESMIDPSPVETLVINAMDKDLLTTTNQLVVKSRGDQLSTGIDQLGKAISINHVVLVLPPEIADAGHRISGDVKVLKPVYPKALPQMIAKEILGRPVPVGYSCAEMGFRFLTAEAVVALAEALSNATVPVHKCLTVIDQDLRKTHVKARIGTRTGDILKALEIPVQTGDTVILGGPMTGHTVYTLDMPILGDTDAIMVQRAGQTPKSSDSQCLNCGECVRVCPAKLPVNRLVGLLENSLYREAAEHFDLLSCIECGLCSYVCIAHIPVFHYMMLGKSEYARLIEAEESYG